jgi:hypothetical protein
MPFQIVLKRQADMYVAFPHRCSNIDLPVQARALRTHVNISPPSPFGPFGPLGLLSLVSQLQRIRKVRVHSTQKEYCQCPNYTFSSYRYCPRDAAGTTVPVRGSRIEREGRAECSSCSSYPEWTARANERVAIGEGKRIGPTAVTDCMHSRRNLRPCDALPIYSSREGST